MRRFPTRAVLALFAVLACGQAWGSETDGRAKLRVGEGLLFLPIESNSTLKMVRLYRDTPSVETIDIDGIEIGRKLRLLKLPAGDWRLGYVRLDGRWETRFNSSEKYVPRFHVEPGVLNYCGDLHVLSNNQGLRALGSNESLGEADVLLAQTAKVRPDLLTALPFSVCDSVLGRPAVGATAPTTYEGWRALMEAGKSYDDLALLNEVLTKLGQPTVALGDERSLMQTRWKEAPAKFMRTADYDEDARWFWINLRGLWGEQGDSIIARFAFSDGKLARVTLRCVRGSRWMAPPPSAIADLREWIATRA